MGFALNQQVVLETEECCNCGILFDNGGSFYCPNGHSQHYTKTEVQRLREALDAQTRAATAMTARATRAEEARLKADKELLRIKKRAQKGVCTCCNRTFPNLARHMATKHPEKT